MQPLKIYLAAIEDALYGAFQHHSVGIPNIEVYKGNILDLNIGAVVSPANSFGFMNGGIDLIYSQFFGWEVQNTLQGVINQSRMGEIPVGCAEIVRAYNDKIPFVISAPTMRVPMRIVGSINAYLATKAVLNLISSRTTLYEKMVERGGIAFPGMGTGCGQMPFEVAAYQMTEAIREGYVGAPVFKTLREAQNRHAQLALGGK